MCRRDGPLPQGHATAAISNRAGKYGSDLVDPCSQFNLQATFTNRVPAQVTIQRLDLSGRVRRFVSLERNQYPLGRRSHVVLPAQPPGGREDKPLVTRRGWALTVGEAH